MHPLRNTHGRARAHTPGISNLYRFSTRLAYQAYEEDFCEFVHNFVRRNAIEVN